MQDEALIDKVRHLPPDKQAAVEDFIDFLGRRDEDRRLSEAAARLSEDTFMEIWDNEADAAYDEL